MICKSGFCIIGCDGNNKCPPGEKCENNKCIREEPLKICEVCIGDSDCGPGNLCLPYPDGTNRCAKKCDKDCPEGYTCFVTEKGGQCIASKGLCPKKEGDRKPVKCSQDKDCEGEEICRLGYCVPGCHSNDDCLPGNVCIGGRCTERLIKIYKDEKIKTLDLGEFIMGGCHCNVIHASHKGYLSLILGLVIALIIFRAKKRGS